MFLFNFVRKCIFIIDCLLLFMQTVSWGKTGPKPYTSLFTLAFWMYAEPLVP